MEKSFNAGAILILALLLAFQVSPASSNESKGSTNNFFEGLKEDSLELLGNSVKYTSDLFGALNTAIDKELAEIRDKQPELADADIQDKIDELRLRVEKVTQLKKEEEKASSFTIISKSKKDYRVDIDEVLLDIEPILFDGEIVDYSSKIRSARNRISELIDQKAELNERMVFAPEKGTIIASSKDQIRNEIKQIDRLIAKSKSLIDELEFDLKRKMDALGIRLTRKQIRVITTRVDGDQLSRSFAIFDVTKQISNKLGELMKENSFSANMSVKYYGVYVLLSEILGYSQREYISKIDDVYMPAIYQIENDLEEAIEFARAKRKQAELASSKKIFSKNIESNQFGLEVLAQYTKILESQKGKLEIALKRTNEQIGVAYSTFDTAANSANLVNLINDTQQSFNQIMEMQVPDIIPFENTELETKFQEISDQILALGD